MEQIQIYFKSDFNTILAFDGGWQVPFRLKFYTNSPSRPYVAAYDGSTYSNCHVTDDGRLCIAFDNHGLGLGTLMLAPEFYLDNKCFNDGICNEYVTPFAPIFVDSNNKQYNLVLSLTGSSTITTIGTLPAYYQEGPRSRYEVSDHTQATNDHTQAAADHAQASEDHTAEVAAQGRENTRITNEATRVSNENTRLANETGRVSNEITRATKERERQSHEDERVTYESQRRSAENQRIASEEIRTNAENTRIASEQERVSAESTRQSRSTADHTTAVGDHAQATNDHQHYTDDRATFQTNEAQRTETFSANEGTSSSTVTTSRWGKFNFNETQRQSAFNLGEGTSTSTGTTSRWGKFNTNEAQRQATFASKEADRDAAVESAKTCAAQLTALTAQVNNSTLAIEVKTDGTMVATVGEDSSLDTTQPCIDQETGLITLVYNY